MYFAKSLLTVLAAACMANSVAAACDPPKRSSRSTRVTTVTTMQKPCGHTVLNELIVLQQPVHIRVVQCENELQQAEHALQAASSARENAATTAEAALARVEAGACLLKTMCHTVELNCRIYTEDEVADAIEILIGRYRSAASALVAADALVAERAAQLALVREKVARWQQKEQTLLQQVSALRTEHLTADVALQRTTAATELAGELNSMLQGKTATVQVTESVAVSAAVSADEPLAAQRDQLLQEVDDILNSGSGN